MQIFKNKQLSYIFIFGFVFLSIWSDSSIKIKEDIYTMSKFKVPTKSKYEIKTIQKCQKDSELSNFNEIL